MARREIERTVQPSLLDRLIDAEPRVRADPHISAPDSARRFKATVARDLEWLLNTRRIAEPAPPELEELQRSLYHYGVADVTSLGKDSPESRELLLHRVEEAIALFEPRLRDVRIQIATRADDPHRRELHFHVEAMLLMDPTPERAAFDTVFRFASGEYEVSGVSALGGASDA